MKLYLVQHGNCVSKDTDPDRPLSEQGREEVGRITDFLEPLKINAKLWHSTKTRARQTAEMLSFVMKVDGQVEEIEGFGPNDDVRDMRCRIESLNKDVMLVGHLPFMSRLASLLLAGNENKEAVKFAHGCVVSLSDQDGWGVEWMLTPNIF